MKESNILEFKVEVTNTFLKTVSAFSNYRGGTILFGIDDDGNTIGLSDDLKELRLNIENLINGNIFPKPDYELDDDTEAKTITLTVHEGRFKPYLYKTKAFKRNDTSTVEVDRQELMQLILEGQNMSFEELTTENQSYQFTMLEKKLRETIGVEALTDDILRTLGLFTKERKYNNAAALLADENNFYGIDIARFGESISIILDRRTLNGISILEQYDQAVSMYRQYYQYEVINEVARKKVEKIPENAFREAVANALVHRNWSINANIRIEMFPDRIEVFSPGGLPAGVTKEDYLNSRVSVLRNPILGGVFFRMHYIEQFGTGIRRINEAYQNHNQKPIFDISESTIHVILPVIGEDNLSEDQRKVLDLMDEGHEISSSEVAEKTGFSKSKATYLLKKLVSTGYVKIIGNGRSTKYFKA